MEGVAQSRLVTLGRLALVDAHGIEEGSLKKRRRKLAVLAVLALERRPLSRDSLIEMFWGDEPEEKARHSLSDALSHLRRVIGRDAISVRSAEVALDANALAVDAIEMIAAMEAGDFARALALYGGPLLDGVYVDGSPRFEHWLDRERDRFHRLFLRASREHCVALAKEARWTECIAVAQRWVDAEPLAPDAGVALLHALAAPDTTDAHASAVAAYTKLRARLARDFELAPSAEVAAVAARSSKQLAAAAAARAVPSSRSARSSVDPLAATPAASAAPSAGALAAVLNTRRMAKRYSLAGGALVVLIALAATLLPRAQPPISPTLVAVLPFDARGRGVAELREGMVDLLSTKLDGAGSLRVVDPRAILAAFASADSRPDSSNPLSPSTAKRIARRFGAGLYVMGTVVEAGDSIGINATLYGHRARETPVASASVEGAASDLFALLDSATRQLLTGYPDPAPDRLTDLAALTTTSLPALKAYLAGVTDYRAARYDAAFASFERAAAIDSTFALAHYQLSNAALWSAHGGWDSVLNAAHRAVRHGGRLTRRPRMLVDAYFAFRSGDLDRAEHLYRYVVARYPDDVEAAYQLGDVLFHGNPPRGRSFVESRPFFERVIAIEPGHRGALLHLLRLALFQRRQGDFERLVERAIALSQPPDQTELRTLLAYARDDSAAQARAIEELRGAPDEVVRVAAMRVALFDGDLRGAERISALLLDDARAPEFRVVGHLHLADLALAGGRRLEALEHIDSVSALIPAIGMEYRALHLLMPFLSVPRAELLALRDALRRWNGESPSTDFPMWRVYNGLHRHIRLYLLALVETRLGNLIEASIHADRLATLTGGQDAMPWEARAFALGLSESARGHIAAQRGDTARALVHLERGRLKISEGLLDAPFGSQPLDRFLRAELLRGMGAADEARRWYRSLGETALHMVVFAAPAARF